MKENDDDEEDDDIHPWNPWLSILFCSLIDGK
jgi:hypothetical protein